MYAKDMELVRNIIIINFIHSSRVIFMTHVIYTRNNYKGNF